MATTTYEPIATVTATGSSLYLEATNIPSTYTDLIVVLNIKESGQDGLNIQLGNGSYDTGSNYSNTFLQGNGSAAGSGRASNQTYAEIGIESNEWGTTILHFQNYANTNVYKTILSRTNSTNFLIRAVTALWRSTSAIERIRIYNGSNANHSAGSTMTLYGIANADTGAKATGGVITYDDTYFYHTFGASGTFTPQQSLTADVLVVAGGGAGGSPYASGGGGAGGLRGLTSQSFSVASHTVTVGAGGAGQGTGAAGTVGNSGGNSSVSGGTLTTITATGGGGGGSGNGVTFPNGANGGSGGGAGYNSNPGTGNSGSYSPVEGYSGGNKVTSPGTGGGGGGGAGAAGSGQNGGAGSNTYLSWTSVTGTGVSGYYAGGGGAGNDAGSGTGGLGGGGIGGDGSGSPAPTSGVANTGSGGGGARGGGASTAGNGGSGVVIIRYLKA